VPTDITGTNPQSPLSDHVFLGQQLSVTVQLNPSQQLAQHAQPDSIKSQLQDKIIALPSHQNALLLTELSATPHAKPQSTEVLTAMSVFVLELPQLLLQPHVQQLPLHQMIVKHSL